MSQGHDPSVPRGAVIAMGGLVGISLLLVAAVRIGLVPPAASPPTERAAMKAVAVQSRDLVFIDTAGGDVAVRDAVTGEVTTAVKAGSETGFIRGVMRGMARDRQQRDIPNDAPFRLTRWSNGDLTLGDPATGRAPIELGAFGATNRKAFEVLL